MNRNTKKSDSVFALLAISLSFACTGEIASLDSAATSDVRSGESETTLPAGTESRQSLCQSSPDVNLPPIFRSLTGDQYKRVLASAFPAAESEVTEMENPWEVSEFSSVFTTDGASLKMGETSVSALLEGTGTVATAARSELFESYPCLSNLGNGASKQTCIERVVDGLLSTLYNGEIVETERDSKVDFLNTLLDDFDLDLAIETFASTVMMSPRTVFRAELGTPSESDPNMRELSARELAESLSFGLAGIRPDAPLLAAIEDGELSADEVRQQTRRLIQVAERSGPEDFLSELFRIRGLDSLDRKDGNNENALPNRVRRGLRRETEAVIARAVRSEGSTTEHLLMSDTTLATEETLSLHGIEESDDLDNQDGFYSIDTRDNPGILLQPAMMAMLAGSDHTDPVKRGNFILTRFACFFLPSPDELPPLEPEPAGRPLTVRERLQIQHQDPSCNTCHQYLDGVGLAFEGFDHLGRARELELGMPVDTSGDVNLMIPSLDGELSDAQELMPRLASSPEVKACLASYAVQYATGIYADNSVGTCMNDEGSEIVESAGDSLIEQFAEIFASDLYRTRWVNL